MERDCTIYRTSGFLGKRWTLPLLVELYKNGSPKRYSELKRSMREITPKMLSARLKELEKEGLVEKTTDSSSIPIRCEYQLTEAGLEFISILKGIKSWSLKWWKGSPACMATDCLKCTL